MVRIRWLAAVAAAFVACVAVPEAQAQTWLRWSKASAVEDPAKRVVPPRRQAVVPPTVASTQPKLTSVPVKEPQAEREEAVAVAPATTSPPRGPTVTIIEEASPPAPVFDPQPATATPVHIYDAAIPSAPLTIAAEVAAASLPACSDCPTRDELQAISAAPGNGDTPPEDRQIQSEIKRRLLQGN